MYKVLVVDDEKFVRQNVVNSIEWDKLDLQIIAQAVNGQDALTKIEQYLPNIIITDIKMPLVDGIQLIKLVKPKYPNIYFIILSGYDDFIFTKEAIKLGVNNYIRKPIEEEELKETLVHIVQKIRYEESLKDDKAMLIKHSENTMYMVRNNLLNQLVHKNILTSELQAVLSGSQFAIFILGYRLSENLNVSEQMVLELFKKKLTSILGGETSKSNQFLIFEDTHYNKTISIIANGNHLELHRIEEILSNIKLDIDPIIFNGAASQIFDDIWKIKDIYQRTVHLLKSTLLISHPLIINESMLIQPNQDFLEFIYASLSRINQLIEDRKFNQINAALEDVLSDKNKAYFSIDLLESVVINIGNTLKKVIALYNLDIKTIKLDMIYDSNFIMKFQNLVEINRYFENIINEIFSSFPYVNDTSIIDKVILYVTTHFNTELTLSGVAKEFYINPSYLSSAFKNKTGTNFSIYIEDLRVKHAIRLLSNSNMDIGEIANEVGYTDPNYFSKIFKKKTGESPSRYLKRRN